ncbi:HEAT repeat domain-containing protein [Nocardia sp. NPDC051321]|uniref:HEAT repeat domain-containing protein n=1 Tax=Nocardia sp. NPDC051321 TaxID=3364323 RepID=UPI0037BD4A89
MADEHLFWVDESRSGDPERQVRALIEIIKLGDGTLLPDVFRLLDSTNTAVRGEAVRAIGYLGVEHVSEVGPVLLRLSTDPDDMVRDEAVEALGLVRYAPASKALIAILSNDESWIVRASAAEALGSYPGPESVRALERVVRDADEYDEVKAYAANALGRYADENLLRLLHSLMSDADNDPSVESALHLAAYRSGGQADVNWVLDHLAQADEEDTVRLLNWIEDLTRRPLPPTLAIDAPHIGAALTVAADRWPLYARQVAAILDKLPQ